MIKKRQNHKLIKKKVKKKAKVTYFLEDMNKNNLEYIMKSYDIKHDIKNEENNKKIIAHHIAFLMAVIIFLTASRFLDIGRFIEYILNFLENN